MAIFRYLKVCVPGSSPREAAFTILRQEEYLFLSFKRRKPVPMLVYHEGKFSLNNPIEAQRNRIN